MFEWQLLFILILISIPGIIAIIPIHKVIYASIQRKFPANKKNLSLNQLIIASTIQTLMLIIIAAWFGTAVNNKIHLYAPFLETLSKQKIIWSSLESQILPACIFGIGGALLFLGAYYWLLSPTLDAKTMEKMKELRLSVGIFGRIFYGGIVEEILCRWGLMAFFVWLGILIFNSNDPIIYWIAILISGVLFGVFHLPAYLAFGCKKSPLFIMSMISMNLWASIIFGWLFWHYGLCSAIIAHMLFHLLWYPFDYIK